MMDSNPHLIEFTRALVREPSVLGAENRIADLVAHQMEQLGYDDVEQDSAGNVIGIVAGREPGPAVLFDAHMDTVDVQPRSSWRFDPFGAVIHEGKIFGRGTSDMKGALAAMVFGIGRLSRAEIVGQVIVVASVGEELTEGSALNLVVESRKPDYVVIGESTGLNLARAGRGRAELVIRTHGKPAHASTPELGNSAVHRMIECIREMEALAMPSHEFIGSGAMCLTDLISEPYPAHSVIPSGCRATYERRLLPGENIEGLIRELGECFARAGCTDTTVELARAEYTSYTGWSHVQPKWYPAWEIGADHELVQAALRGLHSVDIESRFCAYQFCTNAALTAGELGIPTVGFGPSREEIAHTVDEFIELDQLEKAEKGYWGIARSVLQPGLSGFLSSREVGT